MILKRKAIPFTKSLMLTTDGKQFNGNTRDPSWQRLYKKLIKMEVASLEKEKNHFMILKQKEYLVTN